MTASMGSPPAAMKAQPARDHFLSIQVMRGVAAIAVAIYHTHIILAEPEYGGIDVMGAVASKGWMGVNFFFILSGFIIMSAHVNDIGNPARLTSYLWKRFIRVYPIYWVVLTLFLAGAFAGLGHTTFQRSGLNLLSAYLLTPVTSNLSLPLQVAWTLFYEVKFYLLFAVLIINKRAGIALLAIWAAAILIANIEYDHIDSGMLHVWNLYFAIGGLFYFLYKRIEKAWGPLILIVGLALLVFTAQRYGGARVNDVQWQPLHLLALAFPFALILIGGCACEQLYNWKPHPFLLTLGAASYSIYLVHSPAISLMATLNHKLGFGHFPPLVIFTMIAVISVAVGVAFHLVFERPLLAFFQMRRKRAKVASREPLVADAG